MTIRKLTWSSASKDLPLVREINHYSSVWFHEFLCVALFSGHKCVHSRELSRVLQPQSFLHHSLLLWTASSMQVYAVSRVAWQSILRYFMSCLDGLLLTFLFIYVSVFILFCFHSHFRLCATGSQECGLWKGPNRMCWRTTSLWVSWRSWRMCCSCWRGSYLIILLEYSTSTRALVGFQKAGCNGLCCLSLWSDSYQAAGYWPHGYCFFFFCRLPEDGEHDWHSA